VLLFLVSLPTIKPILGISFFSDDEIWEILQNDDDILLIDSRTYNSYLEAHIPTAIFLDFQNVDSSMVDTITAYECDQVIIYCSCVEGANAEYYASQLSDLGLTNIYYMSDDFRDWKYEIADGSEPGLISDTSESGTLTTNNSNSPQISDLLLLNLALFVVVIIIIYKKKN